MRQLLELRDLAELLAREAGSILMQSTEQVHSIEAKAFQDDVLTGTDRNVEERIASRLHVARPGDSVAGEEGMRVDGRTGVRWLVDPIDGSDNYSTGLRPFVTSIGV